MRSAKLLLWFLLVVSVSSFFVHAVKAQSTKTPILACVPSPPSCSDKCEICPGRLTGDDAPMFDIFHSAATGLNKASDFAKHLGIVAAGLEFFDPSVRPLPSRCNLRSAGSFGSCIAPDTPLRRILNAALIVQKVSALKPLKKRSWYKYVTGIDILEMVNSCDKPSAHHWRPFVDDKVRINLSAIGQLNPIIRAAVLAHERGHVTRKFEGHLVDSKEHLSKKCRAGYPKKAKYKACDPYFSVQSSTYAVTVKFIEDAVNALKDEFSEEVLKASVFQANYWLDEHFVNHPGFHLTCNGSCKRNGVKRIRWNGKRFDSFTQYFQEFAYFPRTERWIGPIVEVGLLSDSTRSSLRALRVGFGDTIAGCTAHPFENGLLLRNSSLKPSFIRKHIRTLNVKDTKCPGDCVVTGFAFDRRDVLLGNPAVIAIRARARRPDGTLSRHVYYSATPDPLNEGLSADQRFHKLKHKILPERDGHPKNSFLIGLGVSRPNREVGRAANYMAYYPPWTEWLGKPKSLVDPKAVESSRFDPSTNTWSPPFPSYPATRSSSNPTAGSIQCPSGSVAVGLTESTTIHQGTGQFGLMCRDAQSLYNCGTNTPCRNLNTVITTPLFNDRQPNEPRPPGINHSIKELPGRIFQDMTAYRNLPWPKRSGGNTLVKGYTCPAKSPMLIGVVGQTQTVVLPQGRRKGVKGFETMICDGRGGMSLVPLRLRSTANREKRLNVKKLICPANSEIVGMRFSSSNRLHAIKFKCSGRGHWISRKVSGI